MILSLNENYDILMKKVCKKDLASTSNFQGMYFQTHFL